MPTAPRWRSAWPTKPRTRPAPSSESYLRIDKIIDAARRHGAEAIHPGYGFLSENADFAEACAAAGIVFIGPPAEAIRKMGSKTAARKVAIAAGAPVVPGTEQALYRNRTKRAATAHAIWAIPCCSKRRPAAAAKACAAWIASRGLESALARCRERSRARLRNGEVYLEKLVIEPRHIEIQMLGDHHGHMIHLGERECSIQRRHQKVIEECPSPVMLAASRTARENGRGGAARSRARRVTPTPARSNFWSIATAISISSK